MEIEEHAEAERRDPPLLLEGAGGLATSGRRRRQIWGRRPLAFAAALILLGVRLLLITHFWSHGNAFADSCASKGISTSAGREGVCTRYNRAFGGRTTFNVVDSGDVLRMPEYDAELIRAMVSPTTVSGPDLNPTDYPGGRGLLVSLELSVTNARSTPLEFDQAGADAQLLIATADPEDEFARPQVPYPTGAPLPQLDQEGAVPPHGQVSGWVSFVAPVWARPQLNARPADLELYRPNHEGYVGQIRLWKAASSAGAAAMTFRWSPTPPAA